MNTWQRTDSWESHGNGFAIEITHRVNPISNTRYWNLYAHIFPSHPLFEALTTDPEAVELPMHKGITYFHQNEGITSIGCDYIHAGDAAYLVMTPDNMQPVLDDAQTLFNHLEGYDK